MTTKDLMTWITIGASILAAGMWLGRLQQQVSDLTKAAVYYHGSATVPATQEK